MANVCAPLLVSAPPPTKIEELEPEVLSLSMRAMGAPSHAAVPPPPLAKARIPKPSVDVAVPPEQLTDVVANPFAAFVPGDPMMGVVRFAPENSITTIAPAELVGVEVRMKVPVETVTGAVQIAHVPASNGVSASETWRVYVLPPPA